MLKRSERSTAIAGTVERPGRIGDSPFQGSARLLALICFSDEFDLFGGARDHFLECVCLVRHSGQTRFKPRRELPVRGFDPLSKFIKMAMLNSGRLKRLGDAIRGFPSLDQGPLGFLGPILSQ